MVSQKLPGHVHPGLHHLGSSSASWICVKCNTSNFESTFFHSYELDTHNSFSPLENSNTDIFSPCTPTSFSNFKPSKHSSPLNTTRKTTSSTATSTTTSSSQPPKQHNLRCIVVNCQGIKNKPAELQAAVEHTNPDVIFGSETHIDSSVNTAEVFPKGYTVYRKDRNLQGGGVFLAVKDCFTSCSIPDADTTSELVWASVSLQQHKTLYVGSYYRPPNSKAEELQELRKSL